ncbi:hypothetical protein [Prevotella rectalis]|nr:hypothetical protein [Prevotella brunnea]
MSSIRIRVVSNGFVAQKILPADICKTAWKTSGQYAVCNLLIIRAILLAI